MSTVKQPNPLRFSANLAENYSYDLYMLAKGAVKQTLDVQTVILLTIIGDEGLEIFNTFDLSSTDRKNLGKVLYCVPRANVSVECHVFFSHDQKDGETIDTYKLCQSCEFGEMKESLIKARIISGLRDSEVKTKLLNTKELSLDKCIKLCKNSEMTQIQLRTVTQGEKAESVNSIHWKTTGTTRGTEQQSILARVVARASKPDNTQARQDVNGSSTQELKELADTGALVQGGPQTKQVVRHGVGRMIFPDSLNQMLNDNKNLFEGVGTFKYTHHIKLKEGAEPHVARLKKIPFHLIDSLTEMG
ncbi:hypothetical protein PR048_003575 [Dryococelus australis]|uniref:Uncharacterized protein n=1 Tax=Dryococelus australis TaxID=614101 RepID=A0ABQ9INH4_9NEOP|nr:hypothetical protein PR048_003575 [Dryococelus australis]